MLFLTYRKYFRKEIHVMKLKKILSSVAATVVAVSTLAVNVCAYEINKDFKTGWSISTTIPGSEFADITEDSVITLTYTADPSLADMPNHEYWVIKPMVNDAGWPLVENIKGLEPSEDGSSYVVPVDGTEVKFCFPADTIEHIKIAGIAFMGHGVTLGELTISNDETLPEAPAASENPATGVGLSGSLILITSAGAMLITRKRK